MTMQKKSLLALFYIIVFLIFAGCSLKEVDVEFEQIAVDEKLLLTLPSEPVSYFKSVKPVLERRCVTCHGCYDEANQGVRLVDRP